MTYVIYDLCDFIFCSLFLSVLFLACFPTEIALFVLGKFWCRREKFDCALDEHLCARSLHFPKNWSLHNWLIQGRESDPNFFILPFHVATYPLKRFHWGWYCVFLGHIINRYKLSVKINFCSERSCQCIWSWGGGLVGNDHLTAAWPTASSNHSISNDFPWFLTIFVWCAPRTKWFQKKEIKMYFDPSKIKFSKKLIFFSFYLVHHFSRRFFLCFPDNQVSTFYFIRIKNVFSYKKRTPVPRFPAPNLRQNAWLPADLPIFRIFLPSFPFLFFFYF